MTQHDTVVPFPGKAETRKASSSEQIWGKAVMALGYTAVPVVMVRAQSRLGINATQFNILVQLLEYWRSPERRPFPTKKEIAGRIGLTEKTVQLNIRELEKAGLVRREQRKSPAGDWSSNVYHLDGLVGRVRKLEPEFSEERRKRAEERRKVETPKGQRARQVPEIIYPGRMQAEAVPGCTIRNIAGGGDNFKHREHVWMRLISGTWSRRFR